MILAAMWVGAALHTSLAMRRYGRRWWLWFVLSLLLTVVPAAVVAHVDFFRELRRQQRLAATGGDGVRRCRHCGAVLTDGGAHTGRSGSSGPDPTDEAAPAVCPHCGMALEDEHLA